MPNLLSTRFTQRIHKAGGFLILGLLILAGFSYDIFPNQANPNWFSIGVTTILLFVLGVLFIFSWVAGKQTQIIRGNLFNGLLIFLLFLVISSVSNYSPANFYNYWFGETNAFFWAAMGLGAILWAQLYQESTMYQRWLKYFLVAFLVGNLVALIILIGGKAGIAGIPDLSSAALAINANAQFIGIVLILLAPYLMEKENRTFGIIVQAFAVTLLVFAADLTGVLILLASVVFALTVKQLAHYLNYYLITFTVSVILVLVVSLIPQIANARNQLWGSYQPVDLVATATSQIKAATAGNIFFGTSGGDFQSDYLLSQVPGTSSTNSTQLNYVYRGEWAVLLKQSGLITLLLMILIFGLIIKVFWEKNQALQHIPRLALMGVVYLVVVLLHFLVLTLTPQMLVGMMLILAMLIHVDSESYWDDLRLRIPLGVGTLAIGLFSIIVLPTVLIGIVYTNVVYGFTKQKASYAEERKNNPALLPTVLYQLRSINPYETNYWLEIGVLHAAAAQDQYTKNYYLGVERYKRDVELAKDMADQIIFLQPKSYLAWNGRFQIMNILNQSGVDARESLSISARKLQQLAPNNAVIAMNLYQYYQNNDASEAYGFITNAYKSNPKDLKIVVEYVKSLRLQSKNSEAKQVLIDAIGVDYDINPRAEYVNQSDYQQAIDILKDIIKAENDATQKQQNSKPADKK